jgi:uncharacterized Tic20 family protein
MDTDNITEGDNIGAIAEAIFILGLLFVGLGYLALLGLYFLKKGSASRESINHLKQTLIAGAISLLIALSVVLYISTVTGLASATALILIELYLMVIIPLFMVFGIFGFIKAVNHKDYAFPIIGKMLSIKTG